MNHRIANSLALLGSTVQIQMSRIAPQPAALQPGQVRHLLEDIVARVETIGRLHRHLASSPDGGELNLGSYISEICHCLVGAFADPERTRLSVDCRVDCPVSSQEAVAIGLITNEVLTNAIKYAHPAGVSGRIEVSLLARAEGGVLLGIRDDGVGLPVGMDPSSAGGSGFRLIRLLSDRLDATYDFTSTDCGLTFRLAIPRLSLQNGSASAA